MAGAALLRLDGDDCRTQPHEDLRPVPEVGADIEDQVTGLHELRVERGEPRLQRAPAEE